jgi:hypothetical protein
MEPKEFIKLLGIQKEMSERERKKYLEKVYKQLTQQTHDSKSKR